MAKTKNEARTAWHEAEEDYRKVCEPYFIDKGTAALDRAATLVINKARVKADRCWDAYLRRCQD